MLGAEDERDEGIGKRRTAPAGASRAMRAMILAAGLGTRMRPLSELRAKPALPVRGRPVIGLLLDLLARHGIRDVMINLHHRPTSIRDAVERERPADLCIHWSEEPVPLVRPPEVEEPDPRWSESSAPQIAPFWTIEPPPVKRHFPG